MNSRQLIVTGFAALTLPCVAWATIPQHDEYEHLGVQSCAASSCHGSAGERNAYAVLQNEYTTWARHDLHSRAYSVLKEEQSQRIAANLGLEAAHTAKICLDCHSDYVPSERRGLQFDLSDGVACEACHGGAEKWLGVHISSGRNKHAESLAAGLYPTEDPVARAKLCLSCHLGTDDKFATHKIMGAGHPRLSFDLQKFTDLQPRHYRVDTDYRARKNHVEETRVWAIGQVDAARQYLGFLQSPRLTGGGMFPELGLFDCHACHHPFKDLRWQANERNATPPGTVLLNDSSLAMSHVIASVIKPGSANTLLGAIRELHLASQSDSAALRAAAAALDRQLAQLADSLTNQPFDQQRNKQMIDALGRAVGEGRFTDYSDAEQATMAMDVYSGITGLYKSEVDALYEAVADAEVTDAKRFDPILFAAVFNRGSDAMTLPVAQQPERIVGRPAPLTQKPVMNRPATRPVPEQRQDTMADMPAPMTRQPERRPERRIAQVTPTTRTADRVEPASVSRPDSIVPTHRVKTEALRVRFSPDTQDRIAVILYFGDEVQLLENAGQWSHVAYDSNGVVRTGWALSRLIVERGAAVSAPPVHRTAPVVRPAPSDKPEAAAATPPLVNRAPLESASRPERIVPTHVVDTDALRVRFTPETNARVAVILYSGAEVQVLESNGGWSRVAYDSNGVVRTGWAVSRLLLGRSAAGETRSRNMNRPADRPIDRPKPVAPPAVSETKAPPLVSAAPLAPATQPERIVPTHTVGANALRLRLTPEASAKIAIVLNSGEEVQVLENAGEWTQVAYESDGTVHTGWVASGLIVERSASGAAAPAKPAAKPNAPAATTPPLVTRAPQPATQRTAAVAAGGRIAPTHTVDANALRVRFTPDTTAGITVILYSGDEVQLLEQAGEWAQVAYDSNGVVRTGWVVSRFIAERPGSLPVSSVQPPSESTESAESQGDGDSQEVAAPLTTRTPLVPNLRIVPTHFVNVDLVRVRLQPTMDSGIRDILSRGHEMRKLQVSGGWSRVAYLSDGVTRTGWVTSSQIKEK